MNLSVVTSVVLVFASTVGGIDGAAFIFNEAWVVDCQVVIEK